jgi:hypothetical protein
VPPGQRLLTVEIDGHLSLLAVQLVFVDGREQTLFEGAAGVAEKLARVLRFGRVDGEGHPPVAPVEAQAELDAPGGNFGLEHGLGARRALRIEPFAHLLDDQAGELAELAFMEAAGAKAIQEAADDLAPDKGIGHDVGNHADGMGRLENKRLQVLRDGLADKQLLTVLGEPDPLKLALGGLMVLGDARGDVLGVEPAPIDAGEHIGLVVEVADIAVLNDHDPGQVDFGLRESGPPIDGPRNPRRPGWIVLGNTEHQVPQPVLLKALLDGLDHGRGAGAVGDDVALVERVNPGLHGVRLAEDAPTS